MGRVRILNKKIGYSYVTLTNTLMEAGIGDREICKYEAAILLESYIGVRREKLPLCRNEVFISETLENAVKKRCTHYPLQYLIGEWQFCTETYIVTPDCLIPRADTELLVETAKTLLPQGGRFIDLCTGSGCIAISLLAARPDATGIAVDLYGNTLSVAKRNAERNGVEGCLEFLKEDVLIPNFMKDLGSFDLILSNPPYIATEVVDTLSPEVSHEPRAALDGGVSGLDFYRVLISEYPRYLNEGGRMILEIGYDQGDMISSLARAAGLNCSIQKDLGGNDRMAILSPN